MRDTNLVNALRRLKVETGSLACMGCGHEHNCGVSGCAVMREAADRIANQNTHIAALQQEIEKLRGQNEQLREAAALVTKESAELLEQRWIPVEERLPELETPVLVLDRRGNRMIRTLRKLATDKEPVFRPDGLVPGKHITHWMPLPEPPKED